MTRLTFFLLAGLLLAAVPAAHAQVSHEAEWRSEAQQRIEEHRMNTLRVLVLDAEGEPVEDAAVEVAMTSQAFGFGTALTASMLRSGPEEYRRYVYDLTGNDRSFNLAVFANAMKWPNWASYSNSVKDVRVQDIFALVSRGIAFRGHTLVWPGEQTLPASVRDATDAEVIRGLIRDHIDEIIDYTSSGGLPMDKLVREWDVLNEPYHNSYLANKLEGQEGYATGEEIYAEAFEWAHQADPDARLFINEYNVISGSFSERQGYKNIIRRLIDAEAPISGIGMQGHFNGSTPPSMSVVESVLDDFAQFDLPISVTEYDLTNTGGTVNDEFAGEYMRDFLTMVYSHPAVESFVMWGFWDGDHWRDYAPVFFQDWTLKPSGKAFIDLAFDEWWTDETGTTDTAGTYSADGHLGTYRVTVAYGEEVMSQSQYVLERGEAQELVFQLTSTATEEARVPNQFRVEALYPNPLTDRATLAYVLPQASEVALEVYDLMGRLVQARSAGWLAEGAYELEVDAAGLPAGVYVYRLSAGGDSHTGRLHVLR